MDHLLTSLSNSEMSAQDPPLSQMALTEESEATSSTPITPTTPTLLAESLEIILSISPKPIETAHSITPPSTPSPPPASLSPIPLRYPDTLNTLIGIRSSESKGLGVFALRDIMPGTILLCEAPLVTLIDTGSRADPLDAAVNSLSLSKKKSFLSLHSFSRNKNESLSRSIVYSNGYSIMNDLATGVFETASRINHSCVPNSSYSWKEGIGRMVWWNRFKLLEGEEVTVDYGHKKKYLEKIYGFECCCGGCTDSGSDARSSSGSDGARGEEMRGIDAVVSESLGEE
jgi:hypothetical protein